MPGRSASLNQTVITAVPLGRARDAEVA